MMVAALATKSEKEILFEKNTVSRDAPEYRHCPHHSATPMRLLGRKAHTVPTTEMVRDRSMTSQVNMRSRTPISWPKSLR